MSTRSTAFKVLLEEDQAGGVDLKFNVKATNYSGEEQQQNLIDRDIGDSLVVLGDMTQVIHGTISTGGSPATLLVMRLDFQPTKNRRRFKSVVIKMTFSKGSDSVAGPEVYRISQSGAWSLLPSKIPVETSHAVSPSIQGGMGPATGTIGYQWQFKKTMNKENVARITGAMRALGPDKSCKNTATWTLLENPDTDSGVPTLLETAILLKRDRMTPQAGNDQVGEKFKATLMIRGEADLLTTCKDRIQSMTKWLSGMTEKGEDVIFNPELSRGVVKNLDNLGDEDLETFTKVVTLQEIKQ